jgi:flagellar hook-length control protein FliK
LTEQIAGHLRGLGSQPGQQIIVRLNPPEMGAVRVTLREEGERIHGVLEVENSQTLTQLQREAPALINRLAESGIELARLDVSLTGQTGRGPAGGFDSLLGDGASGRHEGGSYGSDQRDGFDSPDDPKTPETTEAEAMLRGFVDDESVNVWR